MVPKKSRGGQGRRETDKGPYSPPPPPPPLPSAPRAPKNWEAQGTCVQGLALPTALLCVSGTSLNHLFPCLLEAIVVSFYCYQ